MALRSDASGLRLEDFIGKSRQQMQTLFKRIESLQTNLQIMGKLQNDLQQLLLYNGNMAGNTRNVAKSLESRIALVDLEEQITDYELQRSQARLSFKYLIMERLP